MNKTTLRVWEAVIAAFNALDKNSFLHLDGSGAAATLCMHASDLKQLEKAMRGVSTSQPCNRSTWEALIRRQVPFHLGAACTAILRQLYSSRRRPQLQHSTSSQQHPVCSDLCWHVFRVLDSLVRQASASTSLYSEPLQVQLDNGSVLQATPANAVGQQLHSSGLLELLPQVLSGVAAELQAHMQHGATGSSQPFPLVYSSSNSNRDATAGTPASLNSNSSSTGSQLPAIGTGDTTDSGRSAASEGSNSTGSRDRSGQFLVVCSSLRYMALQAGVALSFVDALSTCWPKRLFPLQIAPSCIGPSLHLASVVLQYLNQQVNTTHQPSVDVLGQWDELWITTCGKTVKLLTVVAVNPYDEGSSPQEQTTGLLGILACHLPCLALFTTCTAYSSLLLQLGDLPGSSNSSSSSSSRSSGPLHGGGPKNKPQSISRTSTATSSRAAGRAAGHRTLRNWTDPNTAWKFACSRHQQVPAAHSHLLQALGCSSKTVLWMAARQAGFTQAHGRKQDAQAGLVMGLLLQGCANVGRLNVRRHIAMRQSADACAKASAQPAVATPTGPATQASCMPFEEQQLLQFLLVPVVLFWAANMPDDAPASYSKAVFLAKQASNQLTAAALHQNPPTCPYQLPSTAPEAMQQAVMRDVLQSASQMGTKLLRQLQECGDEGVQQAAAGMRHESVLADFVLVDIFAKLADASQHCITSSHRDATNSGSAELLEADTSSNMPAYCRDKPHSISSLDSGSSSSCSNDAAGLPVLPRLPPGSSYQFRISASSAVCQWLPHAAIIGQLLEADIRVPSNTQDEDHIVSISRALETLCLGHQHTALSEADSTQQSYHDTCATGTDSPMQPVVMTAPLYMAAVSAGGSSKEQKQLFCIMCSMMKAGTLQLSVSWTAHYLCWSAAVNLVEAWFTTHAHHGTAAAMVPWLVLLGRSWLHLAARLTEPNGFSAGVQAAARRSRDTATRSTLAAAVQQQQQTLEVAGTTQAEADLAVMTFAVTKAVRFSQQVLSWLQSSGGAAALAAAGYLTDNICSQLQQLDEQDARLQAATASGCQLLPDPAALSVIAPHLQAAGLALCTLPLPYACNNPNCTNLPGLSELQLVKGRSCKCGGCHVAHYCSKACQQQHWKQHKPACKAMAAVGSTQD